MTDPVLVPEHAVILVPGFFGFGTFGAKDEDDDKKLHAAVSRKESEGKQPVQIQYFARVADVLKQTLGGNDKVLFISSEPSPTGSLETRTQDLHDQIRKQLAKGVKHIHLIGHSTGGVDVRLVANSGYAFLKPEDERDKVVASIRSVVTVSAPFHGAPVAAFFSRHHRTEYVVMLLSLLSVLTSMRDLRIGGRIAMLSASILRHFGAEQPDGLVIPMFLSGVNANTAHQIQQFLSRIVQDHGALKDLSPHEPGTYEKRGENLRDTDFPAIKSFVTVAPKPEGYLASVVSFDAPILRVLYRYAYERAAPHRREDAGPFPTGEWLSARDGDDDRVRQAIANEPGINDGVVPAYSQTIAGHAEGIVLADHLDIVGHYDGKGGNGTFFKSGADFGDARFGEFWTLVAQHISAQMTS